MLSVKEEMVGVCVCGEAAEASQAAGCKHQPSETGGVTQPYFSCVFTKLLKVASASLRLKDFFDLPAFLQIRPCVRGKRSQVRTSVRLLFSTICVQRGKVVVILND